MRNVALLDTAARLIDLINDECLTQFKMFHMELF